MNFRVARTIVFHIKLLTAIDKSSHQNKYFFNLPEITIPKIDITICSDEHLINSEWGKPLIN